MAYWGVGAKESRPTTPPLHHSTTPPLHHSTTPPLHYSTTPLLHYSTTPLLHYSTTPLPSAFSRNRATTPCNTAIASSLAVVFTVSWPLPNSTVSSVAVDGSFTMRMFCTFPPSASLPT